MVQARWVRTVGIVEGISWLVLLFVAMPLKYGFGFPLAVRVVGSAHGALFVAFCAVLAFAHLRNGWPWLRSFRWFVAALLPFGFFFVDRELVRIAQPASPADGPA